MEEQFEMPETQPESPAPALMHISEDAKYYWPGARNWSLFMAIISFVGAGLIALLLVLMMLLINNSDAPDNLGSAILIYFTWMIIAGLAGVLLLRFSNSLSRAYRFGHSDDIERSTNMLLQYFRVMGVISILILLIQVTLLFSAMVLVNLPIPE